MLGDKGEFKESRDNRENYADKGVVLPVNVNDMPELKEHQSGDQVVGEFKATMGEIDEEGNTDLSITNITAKKIPESTTRMRRLMGKQKPDMAGTNIPQLPLD